MIEVQGLAAAIHLHVGEDMGFAAFEKERSEFK